MGRKKRESEEEIDERVRYCFLFLVTNGFSLRWKFHEVSERWSTSATQFTLEANDRTVTDYSTGL